MALASLLIQHSDAIVRDSGFDVFHYDESSQVGESFGERLASAYEEVFDLGYKAVISVGNDSPGLEAIDWSQITRKLQDGQCVLGPSQRGGSYLMGITENAFHKEAFQNLPWQSEHLFTALQHYIYIHDQASYTLMALHDVNAQKDILSILKNAQLGEEFRRIILEILKKKTQNVLQSILFIFRSSLNPLTLLRAPPSRRIIPESGIF